jgi:membrane protein YqaA with SNARE-associated domain
MASRSAAGSGNSFQTLVQRALGSVRWLYDWVLHWAKTAHAQAALFLIAFAEASFFPVPPDVLLIAMGVGSPKKSFRFAAICTAGSVLGGLLGYAIGWGFWQATSQWFFDFVPGFSPEIFEKVKGLYQDNAFWAVFTAGFTPIPFKIFTIAAGVTSISIPGFVLAATISRSLRFFIVGGLLWFMGPKVEAWIDKYFNQLSIAFTVLLIGGFVVLKAFFS